MAIPRQIAPTITRTHVDTLVASGPEGAAVDPPQRSLLNSLLGQEWIWKAAVAGLCGSIMHTLLMLAKAELGVLQSFQPYRCLQVALSHWSGYSIHPLLPWLLSYLNGSTLAGFVFAYLYRHLPGASGPGKGFAAGVLGWLAMDLVFFPLLGLGPFAMRLGLGLGPALFSLAMMLAYSVVMGAVYAVIDTRPIAPLRWLRPRSC